MATATCKHHWLIGNRRRDGDNSITPEHCKYCGGERDLVEAWNKGLSYRNNSKPDSSKYSEIRYPGANRKIKIRRTPVVKKEDTNILGLDYTGAPIKAYIEPAQAQASDEIGQLKEQGKTDNPPPIGTKGGDTVSRRKYYDNNKEAIIADYTSAGFIVTARKWDIPLGSLTGLLRRWKVTVNQPKLKHEIEALPGAPAQEGPAATFFGNSMNIINLVDQIFAQETDIKGAEMRWTGVKSVLILILGLK